ncbi:MAG: Ig-like domain-containing protein, partial [Gemmatimonadales bacterium]
MTSILLALLAVQQPAQQPSTLPQPVARVEVKPAAYALHVGDTVRLAAAAYDSAGQRLDGTRVFWFLGGGRFEGTVDSTGLVSAGATGTLNVTAAVVVPGKPGRPALGFAQVTVLPASAARIAVSPQPVRMLAGTALMLEAAPYAATGDRRYDPVSWTSARPAVLDVSQMGRLTARVPGQATVTAAAGGTKQTWRVTVVPNPVVRVGVAPADTGVRTGDVIRF